MLKKRFYGAAAVIIGTIIGAGILGIPYVASKSGFLVAVIEIIGIGLLLALINILFGEVILRTKGEHQFAGYSEKYLGNNGKLFATFLMMASIYGTLLAYIIGVGNILSALFGMSAFSGSIVFFLVVAFLLYFGLNVFENAEIVVVSCLVLVALLMLVFGADNINPLNLSKITYDFITPYGTIIFACMGFSAVPVAREILGKNAKVLWRIILIASGITLIIYLLFTFLILGITGNETSPIATTGLTFNPTLFWLGNLFAVFVMFTSFMALAFVLKEMFIFDFGVGKKVSWLLVVLFPIIAFFFVRDFINVISVTGAVTGGLLAMLIIAMFYTAKKKGNRKPEYSLSLPYAVGWVLSIFLFLGIAVELWHILG